MGNTDRLRPIVCGLLLACSSLPVASFDRGGPCVEDPGTNTASFHAELREAHAAADHARVIELNKRYVRAMCSNLYRWSALAVAYLDAGDPETALEVLRAMHERGFEITAETLGGDGSKLARFLETDRVAASKLGQQTGRLQELAERRAAEFRARFAELGADRRPPASYVVQNVCPFECCTYGSWSVREATELFDAPFSPAPVGRVAAGSTVRALRGDVHLRPAPVAVVHDHPPFVAGQIVFLLDYVGEGFHHYWLEGQTGEAEFDVREQCLRPGRNCWAEWLEPAGDRTEPRWWILIEPPAGAAGWTDQPRHFGGKDACG